MKNKCFYPQLFLENVFLQKQMLHITMYHTFCFDWDVNYEEALNVSRSRGPLSLDTEAGHCLKEKREEEEDTLTGCCGEFGQ